MGAYARKKQPELVRRMLLDSAEKLALQHGLQGVTIQAVSDAAGVTKGGLFHHFQSKRALVEGMLFDLLEKVDAEIDARISRDRTSFGRFTRAYVETMLNAETVGLGSPRTALFNALMGESSLQEAWLQWLDARLLRHRDTDDAPMLEVVRLAADGAWFSFGTDRDKMPDLAPLRRRLVSLARP